MSNSVLIVIIVVVVRREGHNYPAEAGRGSCQPFLGAFTMSCRVEWRVETMKAGAKLDPTFY